MAIKVELKRSVTLGDGDSWFGVCPACTRAFPPLQSTAPSYFRDGVVECVGCRARVDLWDAAKSQITEDFPPEWALSFLGAHLTSIELEMQPGQVATVDLTKHGVPSDAVLLHSSYQMDDARGIPRPLELFSKDQSRDPARQTLYCVPIQGSPTDSGSAHGMICWLDQAEDSLAAARIVNAVRDIAAKDADGCVVEAFSAFEISLFAFITRYLDRTCSSAGVKKMLERRLSAFQMMELLPELCDELKLPAPPKAVWQKLQELRKCRNELLHEGHSDRLSVAAAGDFLAAALIGLAFVRHVEQGTAKR